MAKGKTPAEIEKGSPNALRISGIDRIVLADGEITPLELEQDRAKWAGFGLTPGIGKENLALPDVEVLRMLFFSLVPFEIASVRLSTPIDAQIERFPGSTDGAFEDFSLRLSPQFGEITVAERPNNSVAKRRLSMSAQGVEMDLGNGSLHLEVLFQPPTKPLPPLRPAATSPSF